MNFLQSLSSITSAVGQVTGAANSAVNGVQNPDVRSHMGAFGSAKSASSNFLVGQQEQKIATAVNNKAVGTVAQSFQSVLTDTGAGALLKSVSGAIAAVQSAVFGSLGGLTQSINMAKNVSNQINNVPNSMMNSLGDAVVNSISGVNVDLTKPVETLNSSINNSLTTSSLNANKVVSNGLSGVTYGVSGLSSSMSTVTSSIGLGQVGNSVSGVSSAAVAAMSKVTALPNAMSSMNNEFGSNVRNVGRDPSVDKSINDLVREIAKTDPVKAAQVNSQLRQSIDSVAASKADEVSKSLSETTAKFKADSEAQAASVAAPQPAPAAGPEMGQQLGGSIGDSLNQLGQSIQESDSVNATNAAAMSNSIDTLFASLPNPPKPPTPTVPEWPGVAGSRSGIPYS